MSLRIIAAADFKGIVEKTEEFGWPITLTAPTGETAALTGLSTDIYQAYEQDDHLVSLRTASVALRTSSILAAGLPSVPEGVHNESIKPWVVECNDIDGNQWTWKVRETNPDRAIGGIILFLEVYDK